LHDLIPDSFILKPRSRTFGSLLDDLSLNGLSAWAVVGQGARAALNAMEIRAPASMVVLQVKPPISEAFEMPFEVFSNQPGKYVPLIRVPLNDSSGDTKAAFRVR